MSPSARPRKEGAMNAAGEKKKRNLRCCRAPLHARAGICQPVCPHSGREVESPPVPHRLKQACPKGQKNLAL